MPRNTKKLSAYVYPAGYGATAPAADYRPWQVDSTFLSAWAEVRQHTLLDPARLYELWELVAQVQSVQGSILEVGTWRGGSAALMGLRLHALQDSRMMVAADTFAGVVKAGEHDSYYRGGEHANTSAQQVEALFQKLSITNSSILQGIFPDESAEQMPKHALPIALCHIDVDVYQSAKDIFAWVWKRLSHGGVVVFDDYGFLGCEGVTRCVQELRQQADAMVIANLNGHAVVVKIA